MRPRMLVVAALIERDGEVLLSQRRPDQALPLTWEFPGGKIESGESPQVALAREIDEELGCDVEVGRVADVAFHAYPTFDLFLLLYRCHITSGVPRPVDVHAVRWVPVGEVASLPLPPADVPLVERLFSSR